MLGCTLCTLPRRLLLRAEQLAQRCGCPGYGTSHKKRCITFWKLRAIMDGGLGPLAIPLSHRDAMSMRSYCGASRAKGLLAMCPLWSICTLHLWPALSISFAVATLLSSRSGVYRTRRWHCPYREVVLTELCASVSKAEPRKMISGYRRAP